ncbi:glycerate kinase [Leucobacter triazinivorans]|uniref:Glycerate kinase n=1 Tax=Leucobacter triazinivorans TaxID=1784719 RepID=A0A4P6KIH2_9MICO|nr:glycerate kinase [Leucobacter triazinivorans]
MHSFWPIALIAPDSLKGSCSSPEAARALAAGVRAALGPGAEVREIPLADGGEGTLDALVSTWGASVSEVATTDALGRPRTGRVGFSAGSDGDAARAVTAIIETADANGLPLVSDRPLQALDADSEGVGSLILAALDAGATQVLLCLGGSATSDGGAGMLRALGARLLDAAGKPIAPGARGLADLARIDLAGLDPRTRKVSWRVACDVDNPLTGPRGAAAVFGPQKGATAAEVARIDAGLARLAAALSTAALSTAALSTAALSTTARDDERAAGASDLTARDGLGAAGGLALGLVALFGAELLPGAKLVSDAVGLPAALADATLVLTGEGRFDAQSLDGKVVSQVLSEAGGTPVVVIAGSVGLSCDAARAAGVTAAVSIAQGPASLEQLQADSLALLTEAAAHACALFAAGRSPQREPQQVPAAGTAKL